jgi:hypothetical protein
MDGGRQWASIPVITFVALLGPAVVTAGPAGASCVGPQVLVSSGVVAPGASLIVHGDGFGAACNDTNGADVDTEPARRIPVEFSQEGRTSELGTVDADDDYAVRLSLRIPPTAAAGNATVTVGGSPVVVVVQGPPVVPGTTGPAVIDASAARPIDLRDSPIGAGVLALASAAAGAYAVVAYHRFQNRRGQAHS